MSERTLAEVEALLVRVAVWSRMWSDALDSKGLWCWCGANDGDHSADEMDRKHADGCRFLRHAMAEVERDYKAAMEREALDPFIPPQMAGDPREPIWKGRLVRAHMPEPIRIADPASGDPDAAAAAADRARDQERDEG